MNCKKQQFQGEITMGFGTEKATLLDDRAKCKDCRTNWHNIMNWNT